MANVRAVGPAWLRASALVATLAAFGADAGKPSKPPASAARPPEVIKSVETDDVDGKPGKPASEKLGPSRPTVRPGELDALIEKGLAASGTPPAPATTDEEFIRRVYIDVLGTLPAPGSIRQFVASRDRDKRAALIDALLDHPDYATNWARYWRDVISYRAPAEDDRRIDYDGFAKWLAGQFAANKPWDQVATAIITATGRDDENPATAFSIAEEGQAVELAGEVSRVFMGVQIQCAQCHDHPSDPWKRQQFHEFAAFFSGIKRRQLPNPGPGQRRGYEIVAKGQTHYTMPDLKNPEKKVGVSPKFFLGDGPKVGEQVAADERLKLAAGYVASPENPWFARSFINRTWYALMGEGFYTPIDDLGPTRTANSPQVLDLLTDQWERGGYDVRWLFRTILNTQAYQRQSRSTNTAAGRVPFASNCPSRLRSDQIFDALAHALNLDREPKAPAQGPAAAKAKGADKAEKAAPMMANQRDRRREAVNHAFGVDPSTPNDDVLGTIPQALYLMNGPLISREVQARPNTMLGELLTATNDNRAALDALYLKVLARRPTLREVNTCSHFLGTVGDRREAFEDILWALLNSTEFVSRR